MRSVSMRTGLLMVVSAPFLLNGCASRQTPIERAVKAPALQLSLNGSSNVPVGDPDGSGSARISIEEASNTICIVLSTTNLSPIDLAHIHRGGAGQVGPVVVPVDPPDRNPNDDCKLVNNALLQEIRSDPDAFYIDVHSTEYPRGAIRGQLPRS